MLRRSFRQNSEPAGAAEQEKAIRLRSFKGDEWHNISIEEKTCDCPNFGMKAGGCEHLTALGIHRLKPFTPTTHPTFSQALSALLSPFDCEELKMRCIG
jgi:hypothetical protein